MNLLTNRIRAILLCHRGMLKRGVVHWLLSSFPIQKYAEGKVRNCRGRHYIVLFFLQKAFATEVWSGRVEGGRLPSSLTVHQTFIRGMCMKDRKCHPVSKMPGTAVQGSLLPTPGVLYSTTSIRETKELLDTPIARRTAAVPVATHSALSYTHTSQRPQKHLSHFSTLLSQQFLLPPSQLPHFICHTHSTHLTSGC